MDKIRLGLLTILKKNFRLLSHGWAKKNNTLISGNAGDKKSLPGRPQKNVYIYLIEFFK